MLGTSKVHEYYINIALLHFKLCHCDIVLHDIVLHDNVFDQCRMPAEMIADLSSAVSGSR